MDVRAGPYGRLSAEELMLLNCGVGEDLRVPWTARGSNQSILKEISPSNEYSGLISFRMDWFDLLALQRTLKSSPTPQFKNHHSSVLSLLYGPALTPICDYCKIIALTRWTFVGKVMSLLFHMQSKLVIAFLPRSKCLLISWLQAPFAVILEPVTFL